MSATLNKKKVAIGASITLTLGAALGVITYLASHQSGATGRFDMQPVRACYGTASLCAALLSANGPEQFRAMAGLGAEPSNAPARSLFAPNAPGVAGKLRGVPAAAASTQNFPRVAARSQRVRMAPQMSVGLYFSTTTGNTETIAGYIAEKTGISDFKDIADADADEVAGHDALIVGAPTWHTGADTERSGTSWDEWLYNELPNINLKGKKVAIFGVGDSQGYTDNFCDAAGEIYDCFTARGVKVYGMTPSDDGIEYAESKSIVDGKFVGKIFDEDNYSDESEERAGAWVDQLKKEGFM